MCVNLFSENTMSSRCCIGHRHRHNESMIFGRMKADPIESKLHQKAINELTHTVNHNFGQKRWQTRRTKRITLAFLLTYCSFQQSIRNRVFLYSNFMHQLFNFEKEKEKKKKNTECRLSSNTFRSNVIALPVVATKLVIFWKQIPTEIRKQKSDFAFFVAVSL